MTLADSVIKWYDANARDLPWRVPGTSAWAVLVSEVMLQQTPVVRVTPAWQAWLARWPEPSPAHASYFRRIVEGPDHTVAAAQGST